MKRSYRPQVVTHSGRLRLNLPTITMMFMGSPESENWRIDDEMQHEVTVASFYIDPFETTQEDYERLMGVNPSTFTGGKLPVENISWLDAVLYANKKSEAAGLLPTYTITNGSVKLGQKRKWIQTSDRSGMGICLPCRDCDPVQYGKVTDNPTGAQTGTRHVYCGGGWNDFDFTDAALVRSSLCFVEKRWGVQTHRFVFLNK